MGLFDKKYCDICGEKIGLLGNRKLEDGNLCKDCAKKLSPWFSDSRSSTVSEIKEQLAYREKNRERAAQFRTTRSYGEDWKLLLDEEHRWFTVTRARDLADANPDILDYTALTGCRVDIDESRTEQLREDARPGAEEAVRIKALVRRVAQAEELHAHEEDVAQALSEICRANHMTMEELQPYYDDAFAAAVEYSILLAKVTKRIRESAVMDA